MPRVLVSSRVKRAIAWRNLLVLAINTGLSRELFSTDPAEDKHAAYSKVYQFPLVLDGEEHQVACCVLAVGHGTLAFNVVVDPVEERMHLISTAPSPRATVSGRKAIGSAQAFGWFERTAGKATLCCFPVDIAMKRRLLPSLQAIEVEPCGYQERADRIRPADP